MHTDAPKNQHSAQPPTAPPEVLVSLRSVQLIAFDFDGVFTDNTVLVDQNGVESVRCWRGDGIGLQMIRNLGLEMVVISTETNPVVSARCKKLRITCHQACDDKIAALTEIARGFGCTLEETIFVGNDINDADCLRAVGVPIVVADAHPSVLALAAYTTFERGGRGAVREICDLIEASREDFGHGG